jgi:hypothetical protein
LPSSHYEQSISEHITANSGRVAISAVWARNFLSLQNVKAGRGPRIENRGTCYVRTHPLSLLLKQSSAYCSLPFTALLNHFSMQTATCVGKMKQMSMDEMIRISLHSQLHENTFPRQAIDHPPFKHGQGHPQRWHIVGDTTVDFLHASCVLSLTRHHVPREQHRERQYCPA